MKNTYSGISEGWTVLISDGWDLIITDDEGYQI